MNFFKDPPKFRSRAYLDFVKSFDCCNPKCSREDKRIDPDHTGKHGLGQKCDDFDSQPACRTCHEHRTFDPSHTYPGLTQKETLVIILAAQNMVKGEWIRAHTKGEKSKKKNRRVIKLPIPPRYYQP